MTRHGFLYTDFFNHLGPMLADLLTRAGQVQTMTKSKLTYYHFLLIAYNTNSFELNALLSAHYPQGFEGHQRTEGLLGAG